MPQTGTRFTAKTDEFDAQTFAVASFHLAQSYSPLFTLDVHVASDSTGLKATDFLGQNVTFMVWQGRTPLRHITGLIAVAEREEYDGHKMNYYLRVYPPFWRSSLRQNFRPFQQQDIESIVAHLPEDNQVIRASYLLKERHPTREFCVQYGETDHDFLCRLLAEEGIFFYEEHACEGKNQLLVFCDNVFYLPLAFSIPFNPPSRETDTYGINRFRHYAHIRPAYVVTKDYTFKHPGSQGRFCHKAADLNGQRSQYEVMDYPGRFKDELTV